MNDPNVAAVLRPLILVTPADVAPNANGILHHQTMTTTALHDLVLDEHVSIVSFNAGQKLVKREEGQSWADALAGIVVPPKTFISIVAHNDGPTPRTLRGTIQIEEQAQVIGAGAAVPNVPDVHVQRQFGPAGRAMPGQGQSQSPFVRAVGAQPQEPRLVREAVAQAAAAPTKRNVVRTQLAPLSERDPNVAASTPRGGRGQVTGGRPRANGKAGARVNPPRVVPANGETATTPMVRSATVRTIFKRGAPARIIESGGSRRPSASTTAVKRQDGTVRTMPTKEVAPNPGERAIVLLFGHADRLRLRVESHVFIPKTFKPAMTRALNQALGYDGPRNAGGNDVVVCLTPEDIQATMQLLHYGGYMLSEPQRTRVANAIRLGLAVARANGQSESIVTPNDALAIAPSPTEPLEPELHEQDVAAQSG